MEAKPTNESKPDYAAILDRQVRELLSEHLLRKGYEYQGISMKSDNLLGEFPEAKFVNKTTNRIVRLHYLVPALPIPGGVDVVSIHIEDGTRDSFSATEYLKHIRAPEALIDKLRLKNYTGSLEDRIHACLSAFTSVLDQYFGGILDGQEWTHVPIDWQGHK